jgi:hypothetical protein
MNSIAILGYTATPVIPQMGYTDWRLRSFVNTWVASVVSSRSESYTSVSRSSTKLFRHFRARTYVSCGTY